MRNVSIAVAGCGRIAQLFHIPVLAKLPNVKLAALVDSDSDRLAASKDAAPHAVCCTSLHQVLETVDVEAVVVCVPPAAHAEMALTAFQAGKHVYVEKPLATSLEEAGPVLSAWKKAGTVGMMGFNFRHNPLYEQAKAAIASRAIGEVIGARSVFSAAARQLPPWKQTRQTGGGVLLDLASHHIDLTRFLFGDEVATVFAQVRSQRCEGDSATLELRLRSGILVQSFFSMSALDEHRFEVYGQGGKLTLDRVLSPNVEITQADARYDRVKRLSAALRGLHPGRLLRSQGTEVSFERSLHQFAAAVAEGRHVAPTLEDGYHALAVVEAAERSVQSQSHEVPAGVPVGSVRTQASA